MNQLTFDHRRSPLPPWRWIFVTSLLAFSILFPLGVAAFFYFGCGRIMPWSYLFIVALLFGFSHSVAASVRELRTVRINPRDVSWENDPRRFMWSIISHTVMIVGLHVVFAVAIMSSELEKL